VALKLSTTVGTATIAGTADVTAIDSFFDVFIDYAFSVPAGFSVTPRVGHPIADPAAAGQLEDGTADFPASTFSLSMGALDETGNQGGVTGTGVLCEIQYTLTADATIKIEADTLRGGAVVGDAVTQPAAIDVVLIGTPPDSITGPAVVTKITVAPAAADKVNSGRVETFSVSGVTGSSTIEYQFTFGDGTQSAWSTATTARKTYTYAAVTAYNVTVQARLVSNNAVSVTSAPLALTSEAVKSTAAFYLAWTQWNRPACWAFQKQCNGDVNGTVFLTKPVTLADLNIFKLAYDKTDAQLLLVANGICADLNHAVFLSKRVTLADLNTFKLYYDKAAGSVPVCGLTNLHYYTN
jgi:hypothetical protein